VEGQIAYPFESESNQFGQGLKDTSFNPTNIDKKSKEHITRIIA
jgi:hypothetical protein